MLSSTRILRAVALIATLHATVVLPQERAAPRPALRLEPQEVTVEAGGTTEPVVVTLTSPPDAVLQADGLPLTVVLPRAIETLVGVEPEQPVLSFGRDGVATARFRLRTDAATPRARYRAEVVAGARRLVVAVMVLDVRNVRGLPPGPQKPDVQQVSDVPALAASAELAFASVLDPAGTVGLDGTKRTVYGGEVELPEDLVSIVPGAEGWDGRARFAWKSPYAEQYQWDWEVSLQPFPGPQAAAPASGIVASGAVPGQPVADQ
ncbi:MAG: hypothetical protein JXB36_10230, partial [Gammaproteobacteria bacterium]|nr:hypothetical protein [Gammaproteobacteria bacterium]